MANMWNQKSVLKGGGQMTRATGVVVSRVFSFDLVFLMWWPSVTIYYQLLIFFLYWLIPINLYLPNFYFSCQSLRLLTLGSG